MEAKAIPPDRPEGKVVLTLSVDEAKLIFWLLQKNISIPEHLEKVEGWKYHEGTYNKLSGKCSFSSESYVALDKAIKAAQCC